MSESVRSKIEKLEKQMAQIKARIVSEKAKIRKVERKRDTRRKILIGAFFMEEYKEKMDELQKRIDPFLKRDKDRELFNLPPIGE